MHIINVTVRDKIATHANDVYYVCGNSDFVVHFDFDEEWDALDVKTARFICEDGSFRNQVFSGNECPVPIISNTNNIRVGVFAGNLCTTTPARVPAAKSILCPGGTPAAPEDDAYHQVMEEMAKVGHEARSSAEASAQSAQEAATSAQEAAKAEETVGQHSANADTQAKAAATSAQAAKQSETAAASSAESAEKAKETAIANADDAEEAAKAAQASAQTAGTMASQAAASAQSAGAAADEATASKEAAENAAGHAQSLFVVNIGTDLRGSSQEEVRAAVKANKTVLATYYNGRVYHYIGERAAAKPSENGANVPTFYSNTSCEDANLGYEYAQLLSDGKWYIGTRTDIRVPNPEYLTFTGAVKGSYNGSGYVTIHIPKVPEPNVYIVTVAWDSASSVWMSDRTRADINEAAEAGKVCLLMLGEGVYMYAGSYKFVRTEYRADYGGIMYDHVTINDDMSASVSGYGPYTAIPADLLTQGGFLQWDGIMWKVVTIDQLKKELGLA